MAGWNGSGGFTLTYSWVADAAAGIPITASRMDTQFSDLSVLGFGNTLTRDGQGKPSANLPMNGFKHTGAALATASGQYVVYQQVTGGTLAASFSSVAATGAVTGGTITASGVLSGGTISTAGNITIGGTAAVTGVITAANGTSGSRVLNYSQFPATTGTTGTMTFPNGVVVKWGSGSTTNGVGSILFGANFPTACDNVQLTISGGSGAASVHPLIVGTKAVSVVAVYGAAGESLAFDWLAVGH